MQPCLVCGENILSENPKAKYCSSKCRGKAWKIANRDKYLSLERSYASKRRENCPPAEEINKQCSWCGESFVASSTHRFQRFCTNSCARKQYRRDNRDKIAKQKRESNKRNRDHIREYSQRYKDWYRFRGSRIKALERDGYSCQSCGYIAPLHTQNRSEDVVVHHIDFSGSSKKPNHRIENLQTLCRPCHIRLHTHKLVHN